MALDTTRIAPSIDVQRMGRAHVAVIGVGGAANLVASLVRSGLGSITLIDPDTVSEQNLVRQEFERLDVGKSKVHALGYRLKQITLDVDITSVAADVTALSEAECDRVFGPADLILATTDSFAAQSWANRAALKYRIPAVWPGVYAGGLGGEVVFWRPGLPCYRCLMSGRYRAQEQARREGRSADPASDGTTVFETALIDAIAGQLVVGLLTDGAENRLGRLVRSLGDRNFLHVKLDCNYVMNGRDVIREQLGIPADNDRFFAWNVAARRDPDGGLSPCPDCIAFGHAVTTLQESNERSLPSSLPRTYRT
jgi:molybdopterin/thiamine biosynthesis adenylyltransferase